MSEAEPDSEAEEVGTAAGNDQGTATTCKAAGQAGDDGALGSTAAIAGAQRRAPDPAPCSPPQRMRTASLAALLRAVRPACRLSRIMHRKLLRRGLEVPPKKQPREAPSCQVLQAGAQPAQDMQRVPAKELAELEAGNAGAASDGRQLADKCDNGRRGDGGRTTTSCPRMAARSALLQ